MFPDEFNQFILRLFRHHGWRPVLLIAVGTGKIACPCRRDRKHQRVTRIVGCEPSHFQDTEEIIVSPILNKEASVAQMKVKFRRRAVIRPVGIIFDFPDHSSGLFTDLEE